MNLHLIFNIKTHNFVSCDLKSWAYMQSIRVLFAISTPQSPKFSQPDFNVLCPTVLFP